MDEADERARERDKAGNRRDVQAAIRDKFGEAPERKAREEGKRDRFAAAEDRRAGARERSDRRATDDQDHGSPAAGDG